MRVGLGNQPLTQLVHGQVGEGARAQRRWDRGFARCKKLLERVGRVEIEANRSPIIEEFRDQLEAGDRPFRVDCELYCGGNVVVLELEFARPHTLLRTAQVLRRLAGKLPHLAEESSTP